MPFICVSTYVCTPRARVTEGFFSSFFLKWIEMSSLNIPRVLKHSVKALPGVCCNDMKAICFYDEEFMMEKRRGKEGKEFLSLSLSPYPLFFSHSFSFGFSPLLLKIQLTFSKDSLKKKRLFVVTFSPNALLASCCFCSLLNSDLNFFSVFSVALPNTFRQTRVF